jgi:hypothetical protein
MSFRTVRALIMLLVLLPLPARADGAATPSLFGPLGLNTVPNARMDPVGTVRAGVSTMDPYLSAQIGAQLAAPLYVALRQTAEVSSLTGRATRLYPGIDMKLRLHQEGPISPEISVGLQSAFGAVRTAGEYLVLSKRAGDFDFTGGLGWGRLGSAGHIPNPFGIFGRHFRDTRASDGEFPNSVQNWFTGSDIGLFGGVEYFPSFLDKISFKADWGSDDYKAETAASDYHAPQPWSVGISYRPQPWLSVGTAFVGGNKVMATLSLQEPLSSWPYRASSPPAPVPLNPVRTGDADAGAMERAASTNGLRLTDAATQGHAAWALLNVDDLSSVPAQVGRAVRPMANNAGKDVEEIDVVPTHDGLQGPAIGLMRDDVEAAMAHDNGSPQEIWRHADIGTQTPPAALYGSWWQQPFRNDHPQTVFTTFHLTLDTQASVSEKDAGLLYRTGLLGEAQQELGAHVISGGAIRLNIANNLSQLEDIRPRAFLPVRGDVDRFAGLRVEVDRFAGLRVEVDRFYTSWLTSLTPNLHFAATAGLLEEMYQGGGGEILYRPFGKTFAVGMEAWEALKRDPGTPLALGLDGDHILTGHLNLYYEPPGTDLTFEARVGRYLAGDVGGTFGVEKHLDNGVKLRGFITATDRSDYDVFGGGTNLYGGVEVTLPLGDRRYLPNGSAVRFAALPLGRDAGQTLDNPLPLYELTEPMSARQIIRHWTDVTN